MFSLIFKLLLQHKYFSEEMLLPPSDFNTTCISSSLSLDSLEERLLFLRIFFVYLFLCLSIFFFFFCLTVFPFFPLCFLILFLSASSASLICFYSDLYFFRRSFSFCLNFKFSLTWWNFSHFFDVIAYGTVSFLHWDFLLSFFLSQNKTLL